MTEPRSYPKRDRGMTAEEVQRGLFPQTLADLPYRARAFEAIVEGDAAYRRKAAKKAKR